MRKIMVLIFVFVMSLLTFAKSITGKVVKVADGDTVTIKTDKNEKVRIRFWGIDAPEKSQEYGIKSLDVLKKKIDGKTVEVEIKDKDHYGRVVGVVYYQGENINLYMLKTGNVWQYKQFSKNNIEFTKAEEEAKKAKLGLWKESNPTPPWVYRRENRKK